MATKYCLDIFAILLLLKTLANMFVLVFSVRELPHELFWKFWVEGGGGPKVPIFFYEYETYSWHSILYIN